MDSATAQSWLDVAAFQVQDKRRILAEVQAHEEMPPEAIECAKNLVLLTEVLLHQAIAKYLHQLFRPS